MICPKCLTNNKNNAEVCKNCGESLTELQTDSVQTVADENGQSAYIDDYADEYADEENDQYADEYAGEQEEPVDDVPEEEQYTITVKPIRERPIARTPRPAYYVPEQDDKEDVNSKEKKNNMPYDEQDDLKEDEYGYLQPRPVKTPMRTAVTVLLWVIIIAAVVFIGFMLYDRFIGGDSAHPSDINNTMNSGGANVTAGDGTSVYIKAPSVTFKQDADGVGYYECTFYGTQGDSVYVAAKGQYYAFDESGQYAVSVYLKDVVESTVPLEDTYSASIEFRYRQSGGQETPFKLDNPLVFNIPTTQIKLISPEIETQEVYDQTYAVIFKVAPGSTVFVNGVNVSNSHMNAQGRVSYSVTLGPGSSEELDIQATAPYHKKQSKKITVTRAPMNVKLEFSANIPKSVKTNTVKLTGVVDTSAKLSCKDYTLSDVTVDTLTGAYSVNVTLPGYGRHKILLTATNADGQSSTVVHNLLYLPDENEYTRKVWVYDSGIAINPSSYIGNSYLLEGVEVLEILDAPGTVFTVNMGTEEKPRYLAVEYYGSREIAPGDKYRVFGEVKGSYNGMALIGGYFIYVA